MGGIYTLDISQPPPHPDYFRDGGGTLSFLEILFRLPGGENGPEPGFELPGLLRITLAAAIFRHILRTLRLGFEIISSPIDKFLRAGKLVVEMIGESRGYKSAGHFGRPVRQPVGDSQTNIL